MSQIAATCPSSIPSARREEFEVVPGEASSTEGQIAPVTVIVPAYNVATSLDRALESVFSQTVRPARVIVINDGSTDGTANVAASYRDRITYLEQENAGQGAARNAGLELATSEFVTFLDADDYWLPKFLGDVRRIPVR